MIESGPVYSGIDHEDVRHRLPAVARAIFTQTFGELYEEVAFAAFCDAAYGPEGAMVRDFADPAISWRVASVSGRPVGYAKLSPLLAPAPAPRPGAMELRQIYVAAPWQGRGIAEELMRWSVGTAREQGAPELYLTVFDHNERAKRFYRRHGFAEVGRCTFVMGDRVDDDRVWRREI
jgi:GNAT superfamily N-acetyltransferase